MAKPEVPAGPIQMRGKPSQLKIGSIKSSIKTLSDVDLEKLQELINEKKWAQVVNALDAISANAKRVQNSAIRMASKAAAQHWNPLLDLGKEDQGNDR